MPSARALPFRWTRLPGGYALPVGGGEALEVGRYVGAPAEGTGLAEVAGWAEVDVGTGTGVAHALAGTGLALALGTGAATAVDVGDATALGATVGTADGQESLVGTGSGVPVGLAEAAGATADAEALGVADARWDALAAT